MEADDYGARIYMMNSTGTDGVSYLEAHMARSHNCRMHSDNSTIAATIMKIIAGSCSDNLSAGAESSLEA